MGQVREAALRERTEQVECGRGLVVGLHHPLGIGDTRFRRGLVRVDAVAAKGRQLDPADDLHRLAPWLRELPRDPPDLDDRERRAEGQDRGHLQQHLQLLAQGRCGDVAERLGAVARLEQERLTFADLAERGEERLGLAGEDERGNPASRSLAAARAS